MIFRTRQFEFIFPRPPLVMGVVNVTPDSFSDGGQFFDPAAAIAHGEELVRQGAEVLDVGGESTRPHAQPVGESEELRRVIPVIAELSRRVKVPISIDTMKPAVARAALAAGAAIVNDVGANRDDEVMGRLIAETGAGYVVMHMQGTPLTMQANPVYADVVREVANFFADRLHHLHELGVKSEQVVLDVGIGFGKTMEHNLQLLGGLAHFTNLERPVMLGLSRKSFLGRVTDAGENERLLPAALAGTVLAALAGVQMFRTHDVAATVRALKMTGAIMTHKK